MSEDAKPVSDNLLREIIAGTEGAPPGPWDRDRLAKQLAIKAPNYPRPKKLGTRRIALIPQRFYAHDILDAEDRANAEHIARCSPEVVRAICEELLSRRSPSPEVRE